MNHAIVFHDLCKLLFMVSGPKKEVVFEQLVSARPLLGILGQALRYEVLELWRPFILNRRRLVHYNVNNDTALRFIDIRRVTIG